MHAQTDAPTLSNYALIPLPVKVTDLPGTLKQGEVNWEVPERLIDPSSLELYDELLLEAMGEGAWDAAETLTIRFVEAPEMMQEAYRLDLLPAGITVTCSSAAGRLYAVQTLGQILRHSRLAGREALPCGSIEDQPRLEYRGMMLDVARHWHGPGELRRLIDLLAAHKLNYLHLHLSDDQGWRLEIKAYPRLTELGASSQVGGGGGGFLSQEEYRDLQAYALQRNVTIVPEIDMPGHTHAALVSYPRLDCRGAELELYEGTNVGFSTLCVGSPAVDSFVTTVIREVAAMTSGPYVHIGGDESDATSPEDYKRFLEQIVPIVEAQGKVAVGWDEVVHTDIASSTVVQLWKEAENGRQAVAKGHPLLLSPADRAYLDMQYDSTSRIGLHWAGYIGVAHAYDWDPATVLGKLPESVLLGIEAPLWTETVVTRADIDYLAFPRLLGYAEIGWTPQESRELEDYLRRLGVYTTQLADRGIGYYQAAELEHSKAP